MVEYPDLSSLNGTSGIGGLLSLSNSSYPYFWAWILGAFWLIITTSLYFSERQRKGVGSLLSSMAISCFALMVLSTLGSIIGFVSLEIMTYILVFCLMIIGVWFFTTKN